MKISVINGSPKGDDSITLQTVRYAQKNLGFEMEIFNIADRMTKIEHDEEYIKGLINEVVKNDVIVWSFPVYHFTIPYQLKKFIEKIFEYSLNDRFWGKYSLGVTTSIHFYDTMAHNYIHSISEDLGMFYLEGINHEMQDLFHPKRQKEILDKFNYLQIVTKAKTKLPQKFKKIIKSAIDIDLIPLKESRKQSRYRIVLIKSGSTNQNLEKMIAYFDSRIGYEIEIVDISKININGGCTGCCICGYDNKCIKADEFVEFYKEKVMKADAIIFAMEIRDRLFSAEFKKFFDRTFFLGHSFHMKGKHCAYIVEGELFQLDNLRAEFEARSEVGELNLVGVATNDYLTEDEVKCSLDFIKNNLEWSLEKEVISPKTFNTVAGHKIFRDFVYLMGGVFRADYKYYTKNEEFDFPKFYHPLRFFNVWLRLILKIDKFRIVFNSKIKSAMCMKHKKMVDEMDMQ